MKAFLFNILLIFGLCGLSFGSAKNKKVDGTELSKTVSKSFYAPGENFITVSNKYGDIYVRTWLTDSILVKVVVTAHGKSEEVVQKTMSRVDFDFNKLGAYLNISTVFDRKSSALKEFWKGLGDYSKSLLGSNKLEVDYELFVPIGSHLTIDNKFGDVVLPRLSQKVDVNISNGDFTTPELIQDSRVSVSFGKLIVAYAKACSLDLKVSEVEIKKADDIYINSSSSDIRIDEIGTLELDSRNDKLNLSYVDHISGKSNFSKLKINVLYKNVDIKAGYGSISIFNIKKGFEKVHIQSKSTGLNLSFAPLVYTKIDVTTKQDKLRILGNDLPLRNSFLGGKDKLLSKRGYAGTPGSKPGDLFIDAKKGKVNIEF